jgi:hypothetical protein
MYEITTAPTTATSFEALPHKAALVMNGCNTFPAPHTRALLYRTSKNKVMAKRSTSLRVVLRLCPNVQYLFKKKLLTAPLV